ncbi:MAG: tetratricopeptide repeat protein [Candidatus Omnitrophota bacterium]
MSIGIRIQKLEARKQVIVQPLEASVGVIASPFWGEAILFKIASSLRLLAMTRILPRAGLLRKQKIEGRSQRQIRFFCFLFFIFCFLFSVFCPLFSVVFSQETKEEETLFVAERAFDDGFYEVSLDLLERFLKTYSDSKNKQKVNLLIGKCYFNQNKYNNALEKFSAIENDPAIRDLRDEIFYWIAEVHFRGNNFIKAAEYYRKIADGFPKSVFLVPGIYSLGWCLFQQQDYRQALEYFSIIEEKHASEPFIQDARFKIIECLYNLKDYSVLKEKLKFYLRIYARDTEKLPYFYFYLAEAEYYLNNFNDAETEYLNALSNTKDERIKALSSLGLGWACLKLKKYKDAENNFARVKIDKLERSSRDIFLFGKALLMTETNLLDEAKKIYEQLKVETSDLLVKIQAYIGQAEVSYNLAEYKDALGLYKEAESFISSAAPQEIVDKLHYGLAWVYLKEGDFKAAIDEFNKIVKSSEDKVVKISAVCQIGDAYLDSGDINKAIEAYDNILKNYPDNFYSDYVQYQLGLAFLKISNYDAAIIAFKKLKANFPDSKLLDDSSYALGLAYFQLQDYNSSREIFNNFQQEFKNSNLNPQAIYLLGTSLYNLEKFTEAIDVFKNVIRAYGHDNELSQKCEYEIADCFYRMGNEKKAMNRFKALRAKYPDSKLTPEIMWWLGEYYYRHNDLSLSRRYFYSLIQDFPKSNLVCDAYYVLASSFAEESKDAEAIDNFKKVISLAKSDLAGSAAIAIADIYTRQEKYELALNIYNDVFDKYQNLANLIYPKMAETYFKMVNYEKAIEFYTKSLDLVPIKEISSIQFKIAEIQQAQAKFDQAIEGYLKVSYLYSENNDLIVKALLRVAAIYEDRDNFKEAVNIYKRVAALNVDEAKYADEKIALLNSRLKK